MLWVLNKRLNQWKNFKATVEQKYPFISKIDKDTRFILSDLMNKGNVLQKRLELMNLRYDFQFKEALKIAVDYTVKCIEITMENPNHNFYGVEFENALPNLIERIK